MNVLGRKKEEACPLQAEHDRLAPALGQNRLALTYEAPSAQVLPFGHGPCPSGVLTVTTLDVPCPGFKPECTRTIQLEYKVPSGQQKAFHPHPGAAYDGTHRMGFLPNNPAGRRLLTRFKAAWLSGWSLDIGYSVARQKDDQTRWTEHVPHKTSLKGGTFGFPDLDYMTRANAALDKVGIPHADACLQLIDKFESRLQTDPLEDENKDVKDKSALDFTHSTQPVDCSAGTTTNSAKRPKSRRFMFQSTTIEATTDPTIFVPPSMASDSSSSYDDENDTDDDDDDDQEKKQAAELKKQKRQERRQKIKAGIVTVAKVTGKVAMVTLDILASGGGAGGGGGDGDGGD